MLLKRFSRPLIVLQGNKACGNNCDVFSKFETHSHEVADTLIPLQVIDSLQHSTVKEIDVLCNDTDVVLMLIDLVANKYHGVLTKLNFVKTGKKSKEGHDIIDIVERIRCIGVSKAKGLIGIHNFNKADWGKTLLFSQ